jgi:pimeloyl-ACP methyl ester carboxylesterase
MSAQPIITKSEKAPAILEKLSWTWRGYSVPYTVMGEGQPLLLIHGFGASIGHWRKNIPVLAEKGYLVYAIDLLGFGGADKPHLQYSVELWQEQLSDFWRENIGQPTVFVGNSIGGLLTLALMADYPEMTAGGVIINCAGGLNHRPEELNLPLRFIMGAFTSLVTSPVTGKFIFDRVRQKNRIRTTLKQVYRDHTAITDELVEMLYLPSCDEGAREVFASVLAAPPGPTPTQLLARIDGPLLVLWGEDDPWTPIAGARVYQERVKTNANTAFHSIPDAGHCPHDENPAKVNELILRWLSETGI